MRREEGIVRELLLQLNCCFNLRDRGPLLLPAPQAGVIAPKIGHLDASGQSSRDRRSGLGADALDVGWRKSLPALTAGINGDFAVAASLMTAGKVGHLDALAQSGVKHLVPDQANAKKKRLRRCWASCGLMLRLIWLESSLPAI
jgi:hypothetical protein